MFNPAHAGRALILRSQLRYNDVHFIHQQRAREVVDCKSDDKFIAWKMKVCYFTAKLSVRSYQ